MFYVILFSLFEVLFGFFTLFVLANRPLFAATKQCKSAQKYLSTKLEIKSKQILRRHLTLLLFCLVGASVLHAQHDGSVLLSSAEKASLIWSVNNYSFFDNREVHTPYQRSQTLFGSRLGVEVGVQFGPNAIVAGGQAIKDFGGHGIADGDFTFYYHYEQGHISGAFGSFPRERLRRELPDIFVYDSVRYYTPILHGALIQYTGEYGYAEFYCNWLNKQGVGEREIFELVTDGRFGYKGCYAGWNVQLTHFSVPRPADGLRVYDKLMINPHVGYESSRLRWVDAFSFEAGVLLSLNRDRQDMLWHAPMGFLGDVKLRKGRFEWSDRLYVGDSQFTHYEIYGARLHRGDPYYRSSFYNRTDFSFYLLNRANVQCYATASFHCTEGGIDNSQQLILRIFPKF